MRTKSLFILGAGFSRYAGMPLVQELRDCVLGWLERNGANDHRVSVHLKALANWPEFPRGKFWEGLRRVDPHDNRGFEEWMADLLKTAETFPVCVQTYHVLRRACARLLWEKQASIADLPSAYCGFARQVEDGLGVVSFNWDLICERALDDAGATWGYSIKTAPIAVIKPHGSLNWRNRWQQADSGRIIQHPTTCIPIAPGSTLSYMIAHPFEDPLLEYDPDDQRYLTFPGDLEAFEPKQRPLAAADQDRLWNEARELIAKADSVVFIGYSLPRYDALARGQLQIAFRGKSIIACNPSEEALSEFRKVFGDDAVELIPAKFEESRFAEARPRQECWQSARM
jgi:hypothetical protein